MYIVIIVMAIVCCLICLIATVSLLAGIVRGNKKDTEQNEQQPQPQPQPTPIVVVNNTTTEQPADEKDPNAVVFAAAKKTFEDRFNTLSPEAKDWYRDIVAYAEKIDKVKHRKNDRFEEFKLGSARIVRLTIKRGGVFACEFVFENSDFKEYTKTNKLSIKSGVTEMKITDETMVEAAKRSIDIALDAIEKNKEYRKQLAKERRKQNAEQNREEAAATVDNE